MKRKQALFTCLMVLCLLWGAASSALAEYNLSFEVTKNGTDPVTDFYRGDYLILNVVVDNTADLAGCAFTVTYPSDVLAAPATDADGLPVTPGEITSPFPFSYNSNDTHRENASELGKIYFAGAAINTTNGGAITPLDNGLFTITFKVKEAAAFDSYLFGLEQTELFNPAAGYGTDDNGDGIYDEGTDTKDTVPLLVGAVDDADPNWGDLSLAFPVLLATLDQPVTGTFNVVEVPDSDSDGLSDLVETNTGTYVDPGNTGTNPNDDDTDDDGLKDGDEVNTHGTNPTKWDSDDDGYSDSIEIANSTDPNVATPPGMDGYDAEKDSRKYSVSGEIYYDGDQTGNLIVSIYGDQELSNLIDSIVIGSPEFPNAYAFNDLSAKPSYYVKAFIDGSGETVGEYDLEEALGVLELGIDLDMSGSDITMADPCWIYFQGPAAMSTNAQGTFTLMTQVPANETLKAYNVTVSYDDAMLTLVSTNNLPTFAPANVNTDTPGVIIINGFDTTGVTGSAEFGIIEITFDAKDVEGTTQLTVTVNSYGEDAGNQFPPDPIPLDVEISECIRGDADGNGTVDIFDALIVAQYDAQLKTEADLPGFACADVDDSGDVGIFDALKIAQFDAGLIPNLN